MKSMKKAVCILLLLTAVLMMTACDREKPVLEGVDEKVEVQCGDKFNLDEYLNENLKITDETDEGTETYTMKDLKYSVECDEKIYDAETGAVDTGDYGTYDVHLTVSDEAGNDAELDLKLILNPVEVTKGFYTYPDAVSKGKFNVMGYCEVKNTSSQFLKMSDVSMKLVDDEGITVYETDFLDYAPEYLSSGNSCYIMDDMSGMSIQIDREDEIADVIFDFKYSRDKKENDTTLDVGTIETGRSVQGFEATAVVTNPYEKEVDNYTILAGMYDKNGKLIGVMKSY